jgi:hypothetical protein
LKNSRPRFLGLHSSEWTVVAASLLSIQFLKGIFSLNLGDVDFVTFYLAAHPGYHFPPGLINYNPPHFALLIAPLVRLPLWAAFLIWTFVSLAFAWFTARVVFAAVPMRVDMRRLICAAGLATAGVQATVRLGQVSFLIALLVTLAWRELRQDRPWTGGVWFGVALGLKPFLLLPLTIFVIRGRARFGLMAVAAAMLSIGLGSIVYGSAAVGDWLDALQEPLGFRSRHFLNASVAAVVARLDGPRVVGTVGAGIVAVASAVAAFHADEDHAWLIGLVAALVCSPLGWIYYLPMLVGPLVALLHARALPPLAVRLWPALMFPPYNLNALQQPFLVSLTLGSIYAWGLLAFCAMLCGQGRLRAANVSGQANVRR